MPRRCSAMPLNLFDFAESHDGSGYFSSFRRRPPIIASPIRTVNASRAIAASLGADGEFSAGQHWLLTFACFIGAASDSRRSPDSPSTLTTLSYVILKRRRGPRGLAMFKRSPPISSASYAACRFADVRAGGPSSAAPPGCSRKKRRLSAMLMTARIGP